MCLNARPQLRPQSFRPHLIRPRPENRAVVRQLSASGYKWGCRGFLFFFPTLSTPKPPSAPLPPLRPCPCDLAAPETSTTPEISHQSRAPRPAPPFLHQAASSPYCNRKFFIPSHGDLERVHIPLGTCACFLQIHSRTSPSSCLSASPRSPF